MTMPFGGFYPFSDTIKWNCAISRRISKLIRKKFNSYFYLILKISSSGA
jgi:hypothetical protein